MGVDGDVLEPTIDRSIPPAGPDRSRVDVGFFGDFFETRKLDMHWSRALDEALAGGFEGFARRVAAEVIVRSTAQHKTKPQKYATGILKRRESLRGIAALLESEQADVVERAERLAAVVADLIHPGDVIEVGHGQERWTIERAPRGELRAYRDMGARGQREYAAGGAVGLLERELGPGPHADLEAAVLDALRVAAPLSAEAAPPLAIAPATARSPPATARSPPAARKGSEPIGAVIRRLMS